MNEFFGKIIDGVHRLLDPRLSATILLASLALIYGPDLLARPRTRWPDAEGYFIAAAAFAAASLLIWAVTGVARAFSKAAGHISSSRAESGKQRAVEKALRSLSPEERALLAVYVANAFPDRQYLPNIDPLVVGMRDKGILRHTPYIGYEDSHGVLMTTHGVTDLVRRHIRGREEEFLSGIPWEDAEAIRREIVEPANSGRRRRI